MRDLLERVEAVETRFAEAQLAQFLLHELPRRLGQRDGDAARICRKNPRKVRFIRLGA